MSISLHRPNHAAATCMGCRNATPAGYLDDKPGAADAYLCADCAGKAIRAFVRTIMESAPATVRGRVVEVDGERALVMITGDRSTSAAWVRMPGAKVGDDVEIVVRAAGKVAT